MGQDFDDLEAQHLDSKKHTPRPNIFATSLTPDSAEPEPKRQPEEDGQESEATTQHE